MKPVNVATSFLRPSALALFALVAIGGNAHAALPTTPVITLEVARTISAGCIKMAVEKGWKMNIAVVDAGSNEILFERMEGAALGSIEHAQLKSVNSARMGAPTRLFGELAWGKDNKGGILPGVVTLPRFVTFPGGLPIKAGEALIGGVGVSGSAPDNDEACAQAGLDAAKHLLK